MRRSRHELSIDMVIGRGIFKNNQVMALPSYPKQVSDNLKQEFVFTVNVGEVDFSN